MNLFPCSAFVDDPKNGQSLLAHGSLQNRLGKPTLLCTNCIVTLWYPTYGHLGGIIFLPVKPYVFEDIFWGESCSIVVG